jgi:Predicted xylanase/chitin deacetylase
MIKIKRSAQCITAALLITTAATLFSCAATPASVTVSSFGTVPVTTIVTDNTDDTAAVIETKTEQTDSVSTAPTTDTAAKNTETEPVTVIESSDYTVIPRFYDLTETAAKTYLAGYGITAAVEYEYGSDAAGMVSDVVFHGKWDSNNLYIITGTTVTLKVSLGEDPAETTTFIPPVITGNKVAYLTFDDGPTKENTYKILDILDNYGIKATFFVVGSSVVKYGAQLKEIYAAGQTIGCHSYCHVYDDIYTTADMFTADFAQWKEAVRKVIGDYDCKIYRFPAGSARAKTYASFDTVYAAMSKLGLRAFDWTMSNNDVWSGSKAGALTAVEYEKQCFEEQLDKLDASGKKPVIILMHETYSSTVEMLPWAIEMLISKGYCFNTLDNYDGDYYQ